MKCHIKIADRGWILEKCAAEIAKLDKSISFGVEDRPDADLQYYVNYSARHKRVCDTEVAFFTHLEKNENARNRFFLGVSEVDHVVCMADRYAEEIKAAGHDHVSVITPGVDTNVFRPMVRIGVVGRTYHTGRKGEALISQVMDVPGIDWRFTGTGWPAQSQQIAGDKMPDFYNDLDYVLVPSLYEGGPMSVLEGLACGIPIISSDVGFVPNFPHIPFENGNADSLRSVLENVVAERNELRASVLDVSWENWGQEHLVLFEKLLQGKTSKSKPAPKFSNLSATLVTHGPESNSLGGPSVRVPATISALNDIGVDAQQIQSISDNRAHGDVVHVYNVWKPDTCYNAMALAKNAGKKVVLSPIYLNLQYHKLCSSTVPDLFRDGDDRKIDMGLRQLAASIEQASNMPMSEPYDGYHDEVRACVNFADHVICLSDYEAKCLDHLGAEKAPRTIVENPVDPTRFIGADPKLFAQKYDLDEYILCVGRIEPRKNQLVLAEAARRSGRKIVFIGHVGNPAYAKLVKERAGDLGLFIDRLDPADPLLASAFAGASVFALPSWAEGAPLAALEAASLGIPLVLSDRASEQAYFGEFAKYVNPADLPAMVTALDSAISQKDDQTRKEHLIQLVKEKYNWATHAEKTAQIYAELASDSKNTERNSLTQSSVNLDGIKGLSEAKKIYFDVTDFVYNSGRPSGIPRVVQQAAMELLSQCPNQVELISWRRNSQSFFKIDKLAFIAGQGIEYLNRAKPQNAFLGRDMEPESVFLCFGGAWTGHKDYVAGITRLKFRSSAVFYYLIHDLIRLKLASYYDEAVTDMFRKHAQLLFDAIDEFFIYSQSTKRDLVQFLRTENMFFKPVHTISLGNMSDHIQASRNDALPDRMKRFARTDFVLFVSSFDRRKNHELLVNVWRRLIEMRGGKAPHLIFVGKIMWQNDPVVNKLRRDDTLKGRIHHLEDVTDAELDWLYQNCKFTAFPSLYEGWGLPIAESLAYGKFCITTTGSSTEEVAPEFTDLLDPYDFRAWVDRVCLYIDNPHLLAQKEEKIRAAYKPTQWSETMAQAIEVINEAPQSSPHSNVPNQLPLNRAITFGREEIDGLGVSLLKSGWYNPERKGVWIESKHATLRIPNLRQNLVLRLELEAIRPDKDTTNQVTILVNGELYDSLNVSKSSFFDIPISDAYATRNIQVELKAKDEYCPSEFSVSNDDRFLSILLSRAALATEANLEGILPKHNVKKENPIAIAPNTRRTKHTFSPELEAWLFAKIKDNTTIPSRIPSRGIVSKVIRLSQLDRIALKLYSRLFARTNETARMLAELIQGLKKNGRF